MGERSASRQAIDRRASECSNGMLTCIANLSFSITIFPNTYFALHLTEVESLSIKHEKNYSRV
jgi:hypothetical protein